MILGIDLGGTNLCLGLVDGGKVVKMTSVPSFERSFTLERTLEYLAEQIAALFDESVEKIGIGVPSVVDVKKGIVYEAANIPSWKEVHLKDFLEARFGVPVNINNDANCYAMGAYGLYPEDARPETLVTVTLGTGMGIGIVDHGRLMCGVNCGAGELGYLDYNGGCLEEFCSKQFFAKYNVDSYELSKAVAAGDEKAKAIFDEFGRHLGYAVTLLMYAYDPSHVVLGGGIANALPLFRDAMMETIRKKFPFTSAVDKLHVDVQTSGETPIVGASLI
ncbi:MAG: ROK family protein [Bacteroidales bacterium]|nr:ROK family protein [Bacteroidales bacterium]